MAHVERTRAVVEAGETYDGKIIPTVQAELGRPVRVRDDATVQGSIYGETVEMHPGSAVEGSVMASESFETEGAHVQGEVGAPGRVVAENTRVDGTVTGKRVRLTNCVVRGNVVGTEVILESCVVLGIATADRRLTVEDSLCYTIRSTGETRLDGTTLVLPQAIVDGSLQLESPVAVAGLGRLDVSEAAGDAAGDVADSQDAETDGRLPRMTEADLYEQGDKTYLTLASRVLNLEKVTDRLDELERGIMAAVDDTNTDGGADMSVSDVLELLDANVAADSTVEDD